MCYIHPWGKQIRHMLPVKVITFSIRAGGRGMEHKREKQKWSECLPRQVGVKYSP